MRYGILHRSGRYPWSAGKTLAQRKKMFLDTVEDLRQKGLSEVEIAGAFSSPEHPFTTTQLRAIKTTVRNELEESSKLA